MLKTALRLWTRWFEARTSPSASSTLPCRKSCAPRWKRKSASSANAPRSSASRLATTAEPSPPSELARAADARKSSMRARRTAKASPGKGTLRKSDCGQPEDEFRARRVLERQGATVGFGDLAAGGEAEAVAARARGDEALEDPLAVFRRHSGTVVGDGDFGAAVAGPRRRHHDGGAGEVEGVEQYIQ